LNRGVEPSARVSSAAGTVTEPLPASPALRGLWPGPDSDASLPPAEAATAGDRGAAPGSTVAAARTDSGVDRDTSGLVRQGGSAQAESPWAIIAARGTVDAPPREGLAADAAVPGPRAQTAVPDSGTSSVAIPLADPGNAGPDLREVMPERPARRAFGPGEGRPSGHSQAVAMVAVLAAGSGGDGTAGFAAEASMALPGDSIDSLRAQDASTRARGMQSGTAERRGVTTPEAVPQRAPDGFPQTASDRAGAQGLVGLGPAPAGDVFSRASDSHTASAERLAPPGHVGVASGVAMTRAEAAPLPPGLVAMSVASPAGQWGGELGERILWISHRGITSADIQLDPPELGPLQLRVSSHRDGASVHITTHSVVVRDLVEQSLPRLRDMLEASGMNLVNVDVSQQQGGGGRELPDDGTGLGGHRSVFMDSEHTVVETGLADAPRGLIDFYA